MKFFYTSFLFLAFAGFAFGEIRIGGSDLLADEFATALSEYAESRGIEATVEFAGSYPATEGLKNGTVDLAIVAVPDGMDMPQGDLTTQYIGAMVLTIAVPEGNPLSQMNLRQLGGIFGESESVSITRWGELGLTGEWASRSIAAEAIAGAKHSLARDLFRYVVLESRNMRATVNDAETIDAIRGRFRQDNNGIALLHRVPDDEGALKILSIARGEADLAHAPSPEAVADGSYPLRLPLFLTFPEGKGSELKELLRYIVSEEATTALEAAELLPLPDAARDRVNFEFEQL